MKRTKTPHFTRKPLAQAITAAAFAIGGGQAAFAANPCEIAGGYAGNTCVMANGDTVNLSGETVSGGSIGILVPGGVTTGVINIDGTSAVSGTSHGIVVVSGALTGAISNGGVINGTGTAGILGIFGGGITSITNSGTISGGSVGIGLVFSSGIVGDISNSGTISGGTTNGILVWSNSGILGSISNSGMIQGNLNGIEVLSGSVIGDISNGGTIQGVTNNGVFSSVSSTIGDINNGTGNLIQGNSNGIFAFSNSIIGDINNSGTIQGVTDNGIFAQANATVGNVSNGGTIQGSTNGIFILSGSSIGDISNTGTIQGTNAGGIIIQNDGTIGGITNDGGATIYGLATGIALATSSNMVGDISNSGTIIGENANAIAIFGASTISGNIYNIGTLNAVGGSAGIVVQTSSQVTGGIVNDGTISSQSGDDGISIFANSIVGVGITNNATMVVGNDGIEVTASAINGDVLNSVNGVIQSEAGQAGIYINNGVVNGDVFNNGLIQNIGTLQTGITVDFLSTVDGDLIHGSGNSFGIYSVAATGIRLAAASNVTGNLISSGYILSQGYGINVDTFANVWGDLSASGNLYTVGDGIRIVGGAEVGSGGSGNVVMAYGSTSAMIVGGNGLHIAAGTVSGDVSNTGYIGSLAWIVGQTGIRVESTSFIAGAIVNDGTIRATNNGIAVLNSTVDGGIANGAIGPIVGNTDGINLNNADVNGVGITNAAGGVISGAGGAAVRVINTSTVTEVSNAGQMSGAATGFGLYNSSITGDFINDGVIQGGTYGLILQTSASIAGSVINSGTISGSTNAILVSASSSLSDIDLAGGSARIIGNVDAQNTNVNVTSGATFTSEGTFNVSTFNVASGATFNMANDITVGGGAGLVSNMGTLSVADGTAVTINGDYTQSASGLFEIGAMNTGSFGSLNVTGDANVGNALINVNLTPGYAFAGGDTLNVLTAGGVLTTGAMSVSDNSFLFDFTAAQVGSAVQLTVAGSALATAACADLYCEGAAGAIITQTGLGDPDFAPYNTLPTAKDFIKAASQASPELANENIHVLTMLNDAVFDIIQNHSGGINDGGMSSGDAMTSDPGKAWVRAYHLTLAQGERDTVEGYDDQARGVVVGVDTKLSSNIVLGAALAYGSNELDGNGNITTQDINSNVSQAIVYGYKDLANGTQVSAQALVGLSQNDSSRDIALFGETAEGSYDTWFANVRTEVNRNYEISDDLSVTPSLSASYVYMDEESYTEHGSTMALKVNSRDDDSLILGADADASYTLPTTLEDQYVVLTARVGIGYNVLDSESSVKAKFVAGGPEFTTYGIEYDDIVYRGGIGLKVLNNKGPLSGSINYDVENGNDSESGVASASVEYKF